MNLLCPGFYLIFLTTIHLFNNIIYYYYLFNAYYRLGTTTSFAEFTDKWGGKSIKSEITTRVINAITGEAQGAKQSQEIKQGHLAIPYC